MRTSWRGFRPPLLWWRFRETQTILLLEHTQTGALPRLLPKRRETWSAKHAKRDCWKDCRRLLQSLPSFVCPFPPRIRKDRAFLGNREKNQKWNKSIRNECNPQTQEVCVEIWKSIRKTIEESIILICSSEGVFKMKHSGKPEQGVAPAELFYNDEEAEKYNSKLRRKCFFLVVFFFFCFLLIGHLSALVFARFSARWASEQCSCWLCPQTRPICICLTWAVALGWVERYTEQNQKPKTKNQKPKSKKQKAKSKNQKQEQRETNNKTSANLQTHRCFRSWATRGREWTWVLACCRLPRQRDARVILSSTTLVRDFPFELEPSTEPFPFPQFSGYVSERERANQNSVFLFWKRKIGTAFKKAHNPMSRIKRFFESLYACLRKGTRAVIQLYPENKHQLDMLTNAALKSVRTCLFLIIIL